MADEKSLAERFAELEARLTLSDDLLDALSDLGFLESLLYGALSLPTDARAAT